MAGGLMRASAVMASGTVLSRVLGFAKAILLTVAIGQTASVSADAFTVGNMLPNTIYVILMGGMLNAVLVPQIVRAAKGDDGGAGYINKLLTLVTSVLAIVTLIATLLAPLLVWLFALSWSADQLALAAAFAYWCLPQILFYGIYTVMGEVLNARSVFGPYTWAPVLNNVVSIAGILVFMALYGSDPNGTRDPGDWSAVAIAVLAGSATLGVVAQALILFVSWRRAGIRFRPDFAWRGMGLGTTVRIAGWSLATIGLLQVGGWVTSNVVATASGEGPATTALSNAWLILMLPHSVLAVSLATAYFTRFSEAGSDGRLGDFRADLSASTRQVSMVMVLSSALILAAAPFLSRLMQPGAEAAFVDEFALVLVCYVFSLAPFSFLFVMQRAFYALSDTRTPFFFTVVQLLALSALSVACLALPAGVRGAGVTLAFGAATVVQALLATWLLRRKIQRIDGRRILASSARFVGAAVPAAAAGVALTLVIRGWIADPGPLEALAGAAGVAILATAVYLGALALLRAPELSDVLRVVRGRVRPEESDRSQ